MKKTGITSHYRKGNAEKQILPRLHIYGTTQNSIPILRPSNSRARIHSMEPLINNYHPKLEEDHHHAGSGHYGLVILVRDDISEAMPYLNAVLDETEYDHENKVLIGSKNGQRYAFRRSEIRVATPADAENMHKLAAEAVQLVNKTWEERASIEPSFRARRLPAAFEIYRLLPKTNCRKCNFASCLAFAVELHDGNVSLDRCTELNLPEYEDTRRKILAMFSSNDD